MITPEQSTGLYNCQKELEEKMGPPDKTCERCKRKTRMLHRLEYDLQAIPPDPEVKGSKKIMEVCFLCAELFCDALQQYNADPPGYIIIVNNWYEWDKYEEVCRYPELRCRGIIHCIKKQLQRWKYCRCHSKRRLKP